ncbi:Phosphoribosyltransferase [Azotobacter vinelandii CA]|uniref:Phosphoribosyltransferase n=2 Tax=Azotobacter vinelandii TaxID=354 RepID=C1DEF7_AZOVD|nr:phosphoribosyltransferase family protein [Azotobacter vinelandii]ACO78142.1 Phosphoribosyltransferase [Azotobacter vinelandii DJ]AGK16840.1 Phosphoribosyltransferase [Azotobacter vinelandii CA]AGK20283.1 Phosphoribosyltransferase [Azotobacter vinelandii CA6]WKN23852.1 phosphoribosyltransferase [Azotobacter vinelandii]SFX54709.1 Predicted phosphoribosyltransferase [Azotobacter vinelandii]
MHGIRRAPHLFLDRRSAGLELAEALMPHAAERPLVLALPRGGVPVAFEAARMLHAELDILLVRRIGAPGHSGLALGAVIDGAHPQFVVNEEVMRQVRPPAGWFEAEMQRQSQELERARQLYCREPPVPVADRCVILVDDGIDTGSSVRAALKGLAKSAPGQLILAVPVAPRAVAQDLQPLVDELVCLAMPEPFDSIARHYGDFDETTDREVADLLAEARHSAR